MDRRKLRQLVRSVREQGQAGGDRRDAAPDHSAPVQAPYSAQLEFWLTGAKPKPEAGLGRG